jgi:hypothetical protein
MGTRRGSIVPIEKLTKAFPKKPPTEEGKIWYDSMRRQAMSFAAMDPCETCGKKCEWSKAYGHSTVCFSFGQVWCSKKCSKATPNE